MKEMNHNKSCLDFFRSSNHLEGSTDTKKLIWRATWNSMADLSSSILQWHIKS